MDFKKSLRFITSQTLYEVWISSSTKAERLTPPLYITAFARMNKTAYTLFPRFMIPNVMRNFVFFASLTSWVTPST